MLDKIRSLVSRQRKNPDAVKGEAIILEPTAKTVLSNEFTVNGKLYGGSKANSYYWLATQVLDHIWFKEPPICPDENGDWSVEINEWGTPPGNIFSILFLRVSEDGNAYIEDWFSSNIEDMDFPGCLWDNLPGQDGSEKNILATVSPVYLRKQ